MFCIHLNYITSVLFSVGFGLLVLYNQAMRRPYMRDEQGPDSRAFSLCSLCITLILQHWESAGANGSICPMQEFHIGKMILNELRQQRRTVAWFAKEMGSTRSNMYKILGKPHLNSEFILRATRLLEHDFFKEASEQLKNC